MMVRTTILHPLTTKGYHRKTEPPSVPRGRLAALGEMVMMVTTKARIPPTMGGTTIPLQEDLRGLPPLPTAHHPPTRPLLRTAHLRERTATTGGGTKPGKRIKLKSVRYPMVVSGGLGGHRPSTPSSRPLADRTIWLKSG